MKLQKNTWLLLLWALGVTLAIIQGYDELQEFSESKAKSTLDLYDNLSAFSELTEHKSREVINRIELSSRLLAEQSDLVALIEQQAALSDHDLAHYASLLSTTQSSISVITTIDGEILYRSPKSFSLIQNNSLSHRPLFNRTKSQGFAWDIYYDIASEQPSLLSSILVKSGNTSIGQVVIEHKITWFPLLRIRNTELLLVNKHYLAGFHFHNDRTEKIRLELTHTELFETPSSQPLNNLKSFQPDKTLKFKPHEEFNISYYQLEGIGVKKALLSEAPISDRWSMLFMIPIDQEIETLYREVFETITNFLVILVICAVLHKFIVFHFRIRELTFTDELTGLNNRQHYNLFVPPRLKLHDRGKVSNFGLLVIDVDKFKNVNDTYGHPVGDLVLKALAKNLTEQCRESDLLYRFGGEEFLIITEGDSLEQLKQFANRLRELAPKIEEINSKIPGGITISIGASLRAPKESLTALFKRTDDLLYQAKQNGRNRVEIG
ncbi:GGDEF domain-containing protein [Litoribrevibacter euphylliae]|uniref:diguanylate cyclase n=1 Tax=Litoribrevibacter euphylliae TaxID=1834034 RepID=A0ABV7HLL6_9GAMM